MKNFPQLSSELERSIKEISKVAEQLPALQKRLISPEILKAFDSIIALNGIKLHGDYSNLLPKLTTDHINLQGCSYIGSAGPNRMTSQSNFESDSDFPNLRNMKIKIIID